MHRIDVFSRTQNKDPRRARTSAVTVDLAVNPAAMALGDLLDLVHANGVRTGGNDKHAGVFEIQTDAGIWQREDGGALKRGGRFRTWEQVELEEGDHESDRGAEMVAL